MSGFLFIDFETVWDTKAKYGLKDLSVVEYVRDPRFKVFGMGLALNDESPRWVSGLSQTEIMFTGNWKDVIVVGHNIKFDGFILREKYGIHPKAWIDTKGMSRAVLGKTVKNHSLATLAKHFGLEAKGTMKTDGLTSLTTEQEEELAEYCRHDVFLCREIYKRLAPQFPEGQYASMSQTIDMFVNPKLVLNVPLLEKTAKEEALRRETIFKEIGIEKSEFASNKKFPALLLKYGYEVPTKPSPKKKDEKGEPLQIPALALGDIGFIELMENGNEELKKLCEARVAAKSTLLETRSIKLASIGRTGRWPFDVEFSGANQTHRFSGGSGAGGNPQNFTRDSALREAVETPKGYSLVVGDFSNIEMRLVAYLSKDPGLISGIERGIDLYCDFASTFFGRKITKEDDSARRFGKCLAEGTLVLCEAGWTRIEQITENDRIWDGEEWVTHQGLIDNGLKEVTVLNGLWLTPDHRILCGTEWKEAQSVERDENLHYLALAKGSEKLPLQAIVKVPGTESSRYSGYVTAEAPNGMLMSRTLKEDEQLAVMSVPKNRRKLLKNCTGVMPTYFQTMAIEPGFLIGFLRRLVDATIRKIWPTNITEAEESPSMKIGVQINGPFSDMFRRFRIGMCRNLRWIGRMLTEGMNPEISDLFPNTITYVTNDKSKPSKMKLCVYDLLSAGPRNRFTVLTAKGPLIVHNCAILGLGYNMGPNKFARTVKIQTGQTVSEEDAWKAVSLYRNKYTRVPALWERLDTDIKFMVDKLLIGKNTGLPVHLGYGSIWLPSGLKMLYPNLRQQLGKRNKPEWVYDVYDKGVLGTRTLYGGKVLENICQALAGELCKTAMLKMGKYVVGAVHDEVILVVPEEEAENAADKLYQIMTTPPSWLHDIKLEAEVGYGKNWLVAK